MRVWVHTIAEVDWGFWPPRPRMEWRSWNCESLAVAREFRRMYANWACTALERE